MGLASMFLGDSNPFAQWAGQNQNFLSNIGAGLMQGQNLQNGLQIAGATMPQAKQLDLQQAEKFKAEALKTSQTNYTLKLFKDKGFTDLVDLANAGAPMGELMQEYFKRIQPQAAPDPWDGTKIVDNNVLKMGSDGTPSVLWAPPPKNENWTDLTDAQEIAQGLDPKFAWQRGPNNELKQAGGGGVNVSVNNAPAGSPDNGKLREGFSSEIVKYTMAGIEAGDTATSANMTLGQLKTYLAKAPQGFEGMWKGLAGNFGIPSEGLDDIQAAEALISKLVPSQRPPSSGTMSDADLALYKASLPSIAKQPGGNQKIIDTAMKINDYYIQHSSIDRQLALGNISVEDAWKQKQAIPNPLAGYTIPVNQQAFPGITIKETQ